MKFDDRIKELSAVGVSIAANCQACLEYHTREARESGADTQEIMDAIEVRKMVRRGAAAKMDAFTAALSQSTPPATPQSSDACG